MNRFEPRRATRRIVLACALGALGALLQACGGGSDSAAPVTNAAPSEADRAAAGRADLRLTYRVATQDVVLSFLNPFPDATALRVERVQDGRWSVAATLPADSASATVAGSWTVPSPAAVAYRVVAVLAGREVPLRSAAGAELAEPRTDLKAASLRVSSDDGAERLSSGATVMLVGAPLPQVVTWTVRQVDAPATSSPVTLVCTDPTCLLDASTLTGGEHLLTARIDGGPGNLVEVSHRMQVDPNHFTFSFGTQRDTATRAVARAFSDAGVVLVRFTLDGRPYAELSRPNGCAEAPCAPGRNADYSVDLPHAELSKGSHTMRVEAIDAAGHTRSSQATFELSEAPVATLELPLPGALVSGTLRIKGSVTDDRVLHQHTIRLDSSVIAQGTGGSFDFMHDVSKLPPGNHFLDIYANDKDGRSVTLKRRVIVTAPDTPAFERVGAPTLPGRRYDALLAASGERVVVRHGAFNSFRVYGVGTTAEPLAIEHPTGIETFTFAGDWLVTSAAPATNRLRHALAWGPDGSRVDLTAQSGVEGPTFSHVHTSGPWAAWPYGESAKGFVLRQPAGAEQHVVVPPHPVTLDAAWAPLLVHDAGGARLFYETRNGSYVYDTRTRASTPIELPPRWRGVSDGTRIFWHAPSAGLLRAAPASGAASAAPTVLGTELASGAMAGDGVVAWSESSGVVPRHTLKVNDGQGTVTLLGGDSGGHSIVGVAGGGVLFRDATRLLLWTRKDGVRVVFHSSGEPALITQGWVYLLPAPTYQDAALYRLAF